MQITKSEDINLLFEAFLSLRSIDECRNFFDDLCTYKEIADMSQRFAVAKMLVSGRKYSEISENTGASSATISRVAKCLIKGNGGYKNLIDKEGS